MNDFSRWAFTGEPDASRPRDRTGRSAIALVAEDGTTHRLYVRFLGRTDIQPLIGTDNADDLFFSPDGRWLAYTSDETGRVEVYIQAFPGAAPKQQVSDGGGVETTSILGPDNRRPLRWSRDRRELFYWDRDRLMSVEVRPGPEIDSEAPHVVFEMSGVVHFDVAPDGQRFLVTREIPVKPLTRIVVALGGASEIGNRAP